MNAPLFRMERTFKRATVADLQVSGASYWFKVTCCRLDISLLLLYSAGIGRKWLTPAAVVVVALTRTFRVVVILVLMACCLHVPPRLPRRVGRVTETHHGLTSSSGA